MGATRRGEIQAVRGCVGVGARVVPGTAEHSILTSAVGRVVSTGCRTPVQRFGRVALVLACSRVHPALAPPTGLRSKWYVHLAVIWRRTASPVLCPCLTHLYAGPTGWRCIEGGSLPPCPAQPYSPDGTAIPHSHRQVHQFCADVQEWRPGWRLFRQLVRVAPGVHFDTALAVHLTCYGAWYGAACTWLGLVEVTGAERRHVGRQAANGIPEARAAAPFPSAQSTCPTPTQGLISVSVRKGCTMARSVLHAPAVCVLAIVSREALTRGWCATAMWSRKVAWSVQ